MKNIKKIIIKNYKGIDFLEFSPKDINIIVGPNNTGKSSLLNAISLILFAINRFKSSPIENFYDTRKIEPLNHQIYDNNENLSEIILDIEILEKMIKQFKLEILFSKRSPPNDIQKEAFENYHDTMLNDRIREELKDKELDVYLYKYEKEKNLPGAITRRIDEISEKVKEELIGIFEKTLFFKLFLENELLLESYIQRSSKLKSRFYDRLYRETFATYYENIDLIRKTISTIDCNFIYRSQLERIDFKHYFRKLSSSPKFYDILEKVKEKLYYVHDIRESEGDINIVINKENKNYMFVPFSLMGDGFQSLLTTNMIFGLFDKGIILLEEPENSLHPGYLDILTESIINGLDGHQYFFSTHSLDFIKYIIEKAEKTHNLDKILILRLSRNQNKIDREILLEKDFTNELKEIKTDLRGY